MTAMLDSLRRSIAIPRVPVSTVLSAGTLVSFGWLLAEGAVHPLALYLLQVYLTF